MYTIIITTLMSLPIYPLNPIVQDTIHQMNLHLTAGYNGPNSTVSGGPDFSIKFEMVINHPFILRTAVDYRFGTINSNVYPEGNIHRGIISAEAIYYRGTKKLTGYLGFGLLYTLNRYSISDEALDSLYQANEITDVSVSNAFGFRLTTGLRIDESYSLEVGITEVRPKFIFRKQLSPDRYAIYKETFRYNDFRVTLGYLFTLKI